ncbi:MAG: hypothetical protein EBR02_05535 [Alphaproteobacteria bacterium]|nr:hypothetical protein [Alphaproteobacteria bacterium]
MRVLQWLSNRFCRWLSFLLMLLVVSSEWILHALNLPHVEGWWVPLMGSGAFASTAAGWLYKWKKNPPSPTEEQTSNTPEN